MAADPRPKGLFGALGLPLSKRYLRPGGRNRLLLVGGVPAVVAALVLLANMWFQQGAFISKGPLSSAHAALESNCVSCHTPGGRVSDEKCSLCHEKSAATPAVHSFDAHYVYVSGDRTRAFARGNETSCVVCHTDHGGRTASLTVVSDTRCAACHAFSFASHPEFEFAARSVGDDQGLAFTHIKHVERVMTRSRLDNVERACTQCHVRTSDGRLFQPVNFEQHCGTCHLGSRIQSEPLPVQGPNQPMAAGSSRGRTHLALGVETLETIRRRLGPG